MLYQGKMILTSFHLTNELTDSSSVLMNVLKVLQEI